MQTHVNVDICTASTGLLEQGRTVEHGVAMVDSGERLRPLFRIDPHSGGGCGPWVDPGV